MLVWFREFFANSASLLVNRRDYQNISVTVRSGNSFQHISVLTQNPNDYVNDESALIDIK